MFCGYRRVAIIHVMLKRLTRRRRGTKHLFFMKTHLAASRSNSKCRYSVTKAARSMTSSSLEWIAVNTHQHKSGKNKQEGEMHRCREREREREREGEGDGGRA